MQELAGRWALVTGASSGIGEAFARLLAREGMHVALAARREDRLRKLAGELEAAHGVRTHVTAVDLAREGAAETLHAATERAGLAVDLLVNNAGFGLFGRHVEIPWSREREMLELDVVALAHATKLYVADMLKRGKGWVIQVASIGAYQPSPSYAAYSAAKAFVLSFGEALSYELRGSGVKVTVLSPGVTRSEFLAVAGQSPTLFQRATMMSAERVAEVGLRAVLRGRPSVVPGLVNKATAFSMRLLPRRAQAALANAAMHVGGGA